MKHTKPIDIRNEVLNEVKEIKDKIMNDKIRENKRCKLNVMNNTLTDSQRICDFSMNPHAFYKYKNKPRLDLIYNFKVKSATNSTSTSPWGSGFNKHFSKKPKMQNLNKTMMPRSICITADEQKKQLVKDRIQLFRSCTNNKRYLKTENRPRIKIRKHKLGMHRKSLKLDRLIQN